MANVRIGGFVGTSMVDWPHELVATVFFQGCPWRCPYCHNPHLLPGDEGCVEWDHVLETLSGRTKLLDGVVLSGGEPLFQPDLECAIREVRSLGYRIGLHTAGALPERFAEILPLIDWVGFDVKAPFQKYDSVTGVPGSGKAALTSIHALVESGTPFEARTTVHADLLTADDLRVMARELAEIGVSEWAIQRFRPEGSQLEVPSISIDLDAIALAARAFIPVVTVR